MLMRSLCVRKNWKRMLKKSMVQCNEAKALCKQRINEYIDTVPHDSLYEDITKLGKMNPNEDGLTSKLKK